MHATRRLSLGIVLCAVVGAACTPAGTPTTAPTSATATVAPGTPAPVVTLPPVPSMALPSFPSGTLAFATFEPKAGAGTSVQGGATLLELNGQTQVIIGVISSGTDNMAAGIQAGTCDNLTPEMTHRLTDVVSGASVTSLDVDVDTLLATPYSINIFVLGSETESSISCGEIQPVPAP